MAKRENESHRKSPEIREAHRDADANHGHRAEIDCIAKRDGDDVETPERERRGANADFDIVVAIDHRVLGVIRDDPEQIDEEKHPRKRRHVVLNGGERHRDSERKRDAEKRLWQREKALEERIDAGDQQCRKRPCDRCKIGWKDQHESGERQNSRHDERLPRRNHARSQRPGRSAFDARVEIAIGPVVECATGGAHQQRTDDEDCDQRNARRTIGGEPERR